MKNITLYMKGSTLIVTDTDGGNACMPFFHYMLYLMEDFNPRFL